MTMERDEMMYKARAFSEYAKTAHSAKREAELEMAGFLELFHPEYSEEKKRSLIRSAGE